MTQGDAVGKHIAAAMDGGTSGDVVDLLGPTDSSLHTPSMIARKVRFGSQ
jgi:hypothetical protein